MGGLAGLRSLVSLRGGGRPAGTLMRRNCPLCVPLIYRVGRSCSLRRVDAASASQRLCRSLGDWKRLRTRREAKLFLMTVAACGWCILGVVECQRAARRYHSKHRIASQSKQATELWMFCRQSSEQSAAPRQSRSPSVPRCRYYLPLSPLAKAENKREGVSNESTI